MTAGQLQGTAACPLRNAGKVLRERRRVYQKAGRRSRHRLKRGPGCHAH